MTQTVSNDKRTLQLQSWLQQTFTKYDSKIETLAGDASFRRYHRLTLLPKTASNEQTRGYIVMDAPPEVESVTEFVAIDKLLSSVVNVPDIVASDVQQGFLVLQDFGSTEFAHLVANASDQQVDSYYKKAIDTLIKIQSLSIKNAQEAAAQEGHQLPHYDSAMLEREMDLFTDWFLPYIGVLIHEDHIEIWQNFKNAIIQQVLTQPQVVVHRDYHSRNLMQDDTNKEALGVIDFQDAVIGAYSYDLVSLLRDAYVNWNETQIKQWLNFYQKQVAQAQNSECHQPIQQHINQSDDQLTYDVMVMGLQRHLKVLGIFVRLSERDGKKRYLSDIPKVMQDFIIELDFLSQQLSHQPTKSAIAPSTSDFKAWFERSILPAYKQKFKPQL